MNHVVAETPALSSEEKRALLARLLRKKAVRTKTAPASFGQERLWFLSHLSAGNPVYNIPVTLRIEGDLDQHALRVALATIVGRHETLRTSFRTIGGALLQEIAAGGEISLPRVDLGGLPERTAQRLGKELAQAIGAWRFDLARGPLWKAMLVEAGADHHLFLMVVHHTVFDDWSARLFGQELRVLYQAAAGGEPSPLPDLPFQYGDFARWQRESFASRDFEESLQYWCGRLSDAPALELPTDRPRPATQTFAGAHVRFTIGERWLELLRTHGQRWETTAFMGLLAIYQVLLSRYAGAEDVTVGSPVAGRDRVELEKLIGFFANTLVLRTNLSGDPTFHEVMKRVREVVAGALVHQDVPFERLVHELQPERDTSRNPLFQAAFVMLNVSVSDYGLAGAKVKFVESLHPTAKFDLLLTLARTRSGLSGLLEYNTDLFDRHTILRLAESCERLFEAAMREPERRLSELPAMSAAESWQVMGEWNDRALAAPREGSLHLLFERQVRHDPDAVALITGDRHWRYAELDRLADRLAGELRGLGVGPEVTVAVFLPRSAAMIVALLAVLKAGGAYVPMDPAYPPARIAFILSDARTPVVITTANLAALLPASATRQVLADPERLTAEPAAGAPGAEPAPAPAAAAAASAGHLAYVIYTSGSTGTPKGVAIEHGSACALVAWARQVFAADELAGVLACTSICFDLSVFEIFLPLAAGGTVVLAQNALELPGLAAAREVRLLNTVPSALAELLRMEGLPESVRTIILAGEPLPRALADAAYARPHVRALYNLYGPSEDTTYSTGARIEREAAAPPPIGRPLGGRRAYLLDRHLRPVPLGAVGELCLAGAGLARGYLDRPALTAERFIPDEHGEPGARLYRTGDRARFLPDGSLHFLGRLDHQVKVRGFRIELQEIETALAALPALREAVVTVERTAAGDSRLVAFCVAAPGATMPSPEALRSALVDQLPEFMVPAVFVSLPALPRTPNGKLDRKALPQVGSHRPGLEVSYVAPGDDLETAVAEIWQQLLSLDRVGVQDNFFDLGGTSLLLVQVNQRLQQKLGRSLPVLTLLNYPTVRQLARHLAATAGGEEATAGAARQSRPLDLAKSRLRKQLAAREAER